MNKTKTLHWKELKPTRKANPYTREIVVTLKVNSEEMRVFLANAHAWTKGNVSEWLRYAALHFKPGKGDVLK